MKRTTAGDRAIATVARVQAVLDDFYGSDEPRHMGHALQAIRAALEGVPAVTLPPVNISPLERLVTAARVLAISWRVDGQGVDSGALVELVYATEALVDAQLDSGSFQLWNARYMGEPLRCPACGADYAETNESDAKLVSLTATLPPERFDPRPERKDCPRCQGTGYGEGGRGCGWCK